MAENSDKDLVSYGPFTKGVNNRLEDHEMPGDRLRWAVNAVLTDTGRVMRRQGFSPVRPAAGTIHSVFQVPNEGLAFVDGESLILLDPDSMAETILRTDMSPYAPVANVKVPTGETFYSDGRLTGKLVGKVPRPWGITTPSGVLSLSLITGALTPGRYQVAITYIDTAGEESGAGLVVQAVASAGQGVRVSGFPTTHPAGANRFALYVSPPNGELLFLVAEPPLGTATFDILTSGMSSRVLKTLHITPPPPGTVLAYCGGRIYIADGPIVWYTEPLQYGRCRRASSFLLFPENVTVMAGVTDGLYVVADQHYWLSGTDPAAFTIVPVLPFGAAKGSATPMPADPSVRWIWYSDRGLVIATDGGAIKELQSGELALGAASIGATLFLEDRGVKQLVSITKPAGIDDVATASGYVDMEVRKSGKQRFPLQSVVAVGSSVGLETQP